MFELLIWFSGLSAGGLRPRLLLLRPNRKQLLLSALLLALVAALPFYAGAGGYRAHSDADLRSALMHQFDRWEGTPYRYGGNSRNGVDCSGFVHITFRDALGIEVPRSTELLSRCGPTISPRRLAVGDILVFRASRTNLHVGIYVGRGQFIHASKSHGVILSDLSNPYWHDVYVKSVRVIDHRI